MLHARHNKLKLIILRTHRQTDILIYRSIIFFLKHSVCVLVTTGQSEHDTIWKQIF